MKEIKDLNKIKEKAENKYTHFLYLMVVTAFVLLVDSFSSNVSPLGVLLCSLCVIKYINFRYWSMKYVFLSDKSNK
jgi:hypothetical protein